MKLILYKRNIVMIIIFLFLLAFVFASISGCDASRGADMQPASANADDSAMQTAEAEIAADNSAAGDSLAAEDRPASNDNPAIPAASNTQTAPTAQAPATPPEPLEQFESNESTEPTESTEPANPPEPPEQPEPLYILPELPDDVYSFAAELDGVVYSLPAPYAVFAENGWSALKSDLDNESAAGGGGFELIEMIKGEHTIYMGFINNADSCMALSDCYIGMLHVNETDAKNGTRMVLPGGVTIGAGYDDIIDQYGPESKRADYDWGIVSLRYTELDSGLEIELDAESMLALNINYKHFARRVKLPEYTGTPPAIIGGYKTPDGLGGDWRALVCIYGGDPYRLPVPAAELLANGWVFVSDGNQMLAPKQYMEAVELRKDNQALETVMMNPDDKAQPLKYCFISELYYDKHNTKISLELPGGIDELSTVEEVIKAYGEPDFIDDSGSMFISYAYGTDEYGMYFTQSIESTLIVTCGMFSYINPLYENED